MSQPTAYSPAHEFLTDETANPNFPGSEIDIELNALETTTDEILANLALIQRDDGALANGIVTADSLDAVLAAALGDLEAVAEVEALIDSATASEVAAAASQVAAAASAAAAASSASSASTSASTATTQAAAASSSASSASTSASTATTQASNASTSATNAATSASTATTQASNASSSASSASTSASTATTQAGIATTQATNAAASAVAAAASASAASSSFDSFDDRYLGPKASDPTLDNDGNALTTGALYFNTTTGLKIWNGATWQAYSAIAGDMLKSDNLSGLASYPTARTNLGLAIGTDVQGYDAQLSSLTPQVSVSADRTFGLTDSAKQIFHPAADTTARAWTIPANASVAFTVGSVIALVGETSSGNITLGITSDTLVWLPSGGTGSRTLTAPFLATITKVTSTKWFLTGVGIS